MKSGQVMDTAQVSSECYGCVKFQFNFRNVIICEKNDSERRQPNDSLMYIL